MSDDIPYAEAARERFERLTAALGGVPSDPDLAATLHRVASLWSTPDVDKVVALIRYATGRAVFTLEGLLDEVRPWIRRSTEVDGEGRLIVHLPQGVGRRLLGDERGEQ